MIDPLAFSQAPENVFFFRTSFPRDDQRDVLANSFLCRVSEHSLGALIPTGYRPIQFLADDGVIRGIDNGSQKCSGPFCLFSLGDVLERQKDQIISISRQATYIKHNRPGADRRELAVDLCSLKLSMFGK